MLLCRSGSTFFFPVTVLLIPGGILHVVLISFFISARCLWNGQIDFIEKAGGLFRRGQLPLVLNLDECCYYYIYSLLKMKDLAKHFFDHVSSCTKAAKRLLILYWVVFLFVYGSMVQLSDCERSVTSGYFHPTHSFFFWGNKIWLFERYVLPSYLSGTARHL